MSDVGQASGIGALDERKEIKWKSNAAAWWEGCRCWTPQAAVADQGFDALAKINAEFSEFLDEMLSVPAAREKIPPE